MADGASRYGGRDSPLMVWGELGLVKPEHDIIQGMPETDVVFFFRESPEGGFEARTISHSIFTQAKTVEELTANVKESVACHFAERKTLSTIRLVKVLPNAFRCGSAKGEFTVPDDFNDPLPKEIEDLFYE